MGGVPGIQRPGSSARSARVRMALAFWLAVAALSVASARPPSEFEVCQSCHGLCAEGNEALGSPRLGPLGEAYIARQLTLFRRGARGAHPKDVRGTQMRAMAQLLTTDEAVIAVARYAALLPSPRSTPEMTGDVERGRTLYGACAACHGAAGEGAATPGAPRLAGMSDAYQWRQLVAFRSGWRGAAADDALAAAMRAMALTLPDEAALADVIAYIGTFAEPAATTPPADGIPAACARAP